MLESAGERGRELEGSGAQKRGCAFYLGVAALSSIVVVVVSGFLAWKLVVEPFIEEYTDSEPRTLPRVSLSPADRENLRLRLEAFGQGVEEGESTAPLVLTADELNSLIEGAREESGVPGRAHFSIDGEALTGEVSIPLHGIGFPGRFFNGVGTFRISLEDGVLNVRLIGGSVRGKSIPEMVLDEIRKENLAEEAANDPAVLDVIRKLESIEISGGRVIVHARSIPGIGEGLESPAPSPSQVGV